MELMEKLSFVFCFCSLVFFFFLRQCARKNPLYFSIIFETVWILFSLHLKAQKKQTKKAFIFCFCPVPFLIDFFLSTFFPFLLFHHCCLCSLFPFIFLFISTCFALLLFSLFSPSFFFFQAQCFSSSVFLNLMFPYLFFHRRFCVSSFGWINSFLFSLLFLISFLFSSLFFRFRVFSFMSKPNAKFSFFFAEDFFEPSLFLCLISCFSSLRRPYSLSVPCFLDLSVPCFLWWTERSGVKYTIVLCVGGWRV